MLKFGLMWTLLWGLCLSGYTQDVPVIELFPVEVVPEGNLEIYSNFKKKQRESEVKVLSSIALVTGFTNPKSKTIQLEGLELYFDTKEDQEGQGFFVQPVLLDAVAGKPGEHLLRIEEEYLVSSSLRGKLFFDLSAKGMLLAPGQEVFLGIKYIRTLGAGETSYFNSKLVYGKFKTSTYLLACLDCVPQLIAGPGKKGIALKYGVAFSIKDE